MGAPRPLGQYATDVDATQLEAWNDTVAPYPASSVVHLFEQQAARSPEAVAATCGERRLTYHQVNALANELAHRLVACGCARGTLVGACLERSLEMLVGLIGILKTGAAYVPLDPSYPRAHLAFVLNDTGAPILVTDARAADALPHYAGTTVRIDARNPVHGSAGNLPVAVAPDDPIYVMYTSGSTGRPKGVVGLHRGVVNRCAWMWARYPFAADEVCCQKTALNFVDSVAEIFGPLLQGIPLVIVPEEASRDALRLTDALEGGRVSRLVVVPSLLRDLLEVPGVGRRLAALKICVSSGEALTTTLCGRFYERLPHATLVNLYGSTEVSADVTCFETAPADRDRPSIPIGRPIANTRILLLDDRMQPVPVGEAGALYVGGAGLARGYLNQPGLTHEAFVPDPTSFDARERLYRTGDRGRYLPDGNVEFLGRADHQVKIRGVRIEPAEVEAALTAHPDVVQAVVVGRKDGTEETRLVAYVVPRQETTPESTDLRRFCRTRLPQALVPSLFVLIAQLCLLPNGKVDRTALPPIAPARAARQAPAAAPRSRIEEALIAVWRDVLDIDDVGVHDDFFDLGGHSLAAARLFARIERLFGQSLPLDTLFDAPTVARLAEILATTCTEDSGWSPLVPLQPHGRRPPLFLVHGIGGEVMSFAALAQQFGPDRPVYGVRALGSDAVREPLPTVESMAATYLEAIRAVQPDGPYCLAGYSAGGPIALEMAQQLRAAQVPVAALIVIDSPDLITAQRAPTWQLRHLPAAARNVLWWMIDNEVFHAGAPEALRSLRSKARLLGAHAAGQLRGGHVAADIRDVLGVWRLPDRRRRFLEIHHRALSAYVAKPYAGPMTLVRARTMPLFAPPEHDLGWSRVAAGGLHTRVVAGAHDNILREPRVGHLAAAIADALG